MNNNITLHFFALFLLYLLNKCNSKTDIIKDYIPFVNISRYSIYITLAPLLMMLYSNLEHSDISHILIMILYSLLYNKVITAITPENYSESFFPITVAVILNLIYNNKIDVFQGYAYLITTAAFILSNDKASTGQLAHDLLLVHFLFFVTKN